MSNLFRKITEYIEDAFEEDRKMKEDSEEKREQERKAHIEFCLKGTGLTLDNLVPFRDEEYELLCSQIREFIEKNADKGAEDDSNLYYQVKNMFAWREILDCIENRVKEAYHVRGVNHGGCGTESLVFLHFRSNAESWEKLCGREGYMLICTRCMEKLGFSYYCMN